MLGVILYCLLYLWPRTCLKTIADRNSFWGSFYICWYICDHELVWNNSRPQLILGVMLYFLIFVTIFFDIFVTANLFGNNSRPQLTLGVILYFLIYLWPRTCLNAMADRNSFWGSYYIFDIFLTLNLFENNSRPQLILGVILCFWIYLWPRACLKPIDDRNSLRGHIIFLIFVTTNLLENISRPQLILGVILYLLIYLRPRTFWKQ